MKPISRWPVVAAVVILGVMLSLTACSSTPAGATSHSATHALAVNPKLRAMLPKPIIDSGIVRIGGDFATPPSLSADPNDASKAVGIAPDITAQLGKLLGVKFEWRRTAFSGQLPGLQSGSLDALMGQLSVTAPREKTVVDLVPWQHTAEALLTKSSAKVTKVEQLCGLKIGVPTGSIGMLTLQSVNKKYCGANPMTISQLADNTAGSTAVLSGQMDGFFISAEMTEGFVKANPQGFASFTMPAAESAKTNPGISGIGVNKNNPGLSKAIAGALQELSSKGIYQQILKSYGWSNHAVPKSEMVVNYISGTPAGQTVAN